MQRKRIFPVVVALFAGLGAGACGDPSTSARTQARLPAPDVYEIEVTGADFEWHVRYPGPDQRLGTSDDLRARRDVYVPLHSTTRIHLRSRDYIYNLALPHLGLKEAAVPDLEFSLEFRADEPGVFELKGDQMCGWTHPKLLGRLFVEPPDAFREALAGAGVQ